MIDQLSLLHILRFVGSDDEAANVELEDDSSDYGSATSRHRASCKLSARRGSTRSLNVGFAAYDDCALPGSSFADTAVRDEAVHRIVQQDVSLLGMRR